MADKDAIGKLVSRCALRDQHAFAELYKQTSAILSGVVLRIVRRRDWAEEVLQEGFLNIWNHAHSSWMLPRNVGRPVSLALINTRETQKVIVPSSMAETVDAAWVWHER